MPEEKKLLMSQWTPYFRAFTANLNRDPAPGDARAQAAGKEVPGRPARVRGIAYDHKGNALEIALAGREHLIYNPRAIWVTEDERGALTAVRVERGDGTTESFAVR